ncbi:MAG: FAD-dependent oxidoreductase, partial [Chloroflexota bacterium]
YEGAAFSIEPRLTQSAWFRPHNRSEDFENLYFVGAGTHPGAGLPGVLSTAVIAEKLIGEAETTAKPVQQQPVAQPAGD